MKIIINESQYKKLLTLASSNKESLNEGWKEVVLGVAMLLGLNLTGQNKVVAQNALNNEKFIEQIKSTLEDKVVKDVLTAERCYAIF
jgi:hypothetical protein